MIGQTLGGDGLIRIDKAVEGLAGYGVEPLEVGMFCCYKSSQLVPNVPGSPAIPFRLGKVLRVARDVQSCPFMVVESWWPVLKPSKFGNKVNLFGTWVKCGEPIIEVDGAALKKACRPAARDMLMVPLTDVLVWPVDLDASSTKYPDGGRLPFAALHHMRSMHGIDLADPSLTFAKRGKAFYFEVVKRVAQHAHDATVVVDRS
jgi:hypothetical protein